MSRVFRDRAFSLIEVIVVLAMTAAILYAVALLIQRTVGTLNFLKEKSESIQGATLGCERLCSELRETIVAPTTGSVVTLRKVMASAPVAVGNSQRPAPPPAPPPPTPSHLWTRAYPAANTVSVTYSVDVSNTKLLRQVDSDPATVVATDLNFFVMSPVVGRARTYQVDLSVNERRRFITFSAVVYCPGVP